MTFPCLHCPSCLIAFLLFHRLHTLVAITSQSLSPSSSRSNQTTSMNSSMDEFRLVTLMFNTSHVSLAVSQLHRMWPNVSLSLHKLHLSSIITFRRCRQCFMVKMFLQALHTKCLISLGYFKSQIAFQRARILVLSEHPGITVHLFSFLEQLRCDFVCAVDCKNSI